MDVLLPLLLLFLMLPLLWLALQALVGGPGQAGERRVGRVLAAHCARVRNDIILPDDHGGLTQIDHLALVPAGVLVIETKTLNGQIFGRAEESTWTQCIGRRRIRMQNPLRQNFAHLQAVRALVAGFALGLVLVGGLAWLSLPGRPPDQPPGTAPLAVPAARAPAPVLTRPSPPPSADPGVPFPTAAPLPPVAGGTPLIERTGPPRAASSEECVIATARALVERDAASQRHRDFVCALSRRAAGAEAGGQ